MECQKVSLQITCPIHTSEFVQRVHIGIGEEQHLFCLECILSREDAFSMSSKLKTIPDLVDMAATFYARNKHEVKLESQIPSEYADLISGQAEKLEKLSKHIEFEKKKVGDIFDDILKDTVKMITEKKNEYLNNLDQQLFNFRYWYIFFDKQLKKAYPTAEDIPFLFPTKEDLLNKLGEITDATQLMAFVRNLKEDLNEQNILSGKQDSLERDCQDYIQNLSKELVKIEDVKPYYEQGKFDLSNFKTELQKNVLGLLNQLYDLKNPINDVYSNFVSKFVTPEEFEMIQGWLKESGVNSFKPKLLYRASRDGFSAKEFHERCDGKGNTLTLVRADWNENKAFTIGGYLDQPWTSSFQYINSSKSFIFSTTAKSKATIAKQQNGCYGHANQGPTFGGGHDLVVMLNNNQNYMNPHSYTGTAKLIGAKSYPGSGQSYFKALEIEVYTLD